MTQIAQSNNSGFTTTSNSFKAKPSSNSSRKPPKAGKVCLQSLILACTSLILACTSLILACSLPQSLRARW